ncbi:MAG: hypothetical protein GY757_10225 [bacterium]|nr:hypothetical protein [bacterium]
MSDTLELIWVDDYAKRAKVSKTLATMLNAKIKFVCVEKKKPVDELRKLFKKPRPDLILMDHSLVNTDGGFTTGSTAAEMIREVWPKCPIVCITGVKKKDMPIHKRLAYEEVVPIDDMSEYKDTLLSIACSFKKLQDKAPDDIEDFIMTLAPPEDDIENLKSCLPSELKNKEIYQDGKSIIMAISRWVRKMLMEKPGFLYDRLWTATFLGLNDEGFKKVESIFAKAEYRGVFADKSKKRWWQSKLRDLLFAEIPERNSIYPWVVGHQLPGITEEDYCKCHISEEAFPETVGYNDETATDRYPMRLRYTIPHPRFERTPFFEEIRMMKGAE